MIVDQSFHRCLDDPAQGHSLRLEGFLQGIAIEIGDGTIESDRQLVPMVILLDIADEEASESSDHQVLDTGFREVFLQEGHETCQEAIGQFLAVDTVDDLCLREVESRMEALADRRGQLMLQHIPHQGLPQDGPTALIAEDKAQWRYILRDSLPIIGTGITACAQDAHEEILHADMRGERMGDWRLSSLQVSNESD